MNVRSGFAVCLVALSPAGSLSAQSVETVVLRGGHFFDGVGDRAVPNSLHAHYAIDRQISATRVTCGG